MSTNPRAYAHASQVDSSNMLVSDDVGEMEDSDAQHYHNLDSELDPRLLAMKEEGLKSDMKHYWEGP